MRTTRVSNNSRLWTFRGRYSRHQVSHFLPEARVPRGSAPRTLSPPDGLQNQVLQGRRKEFVSFWPSVSNLYQNQTHFPLDQRMVEPNLQIQVSSFIKRTGCLFIQIIFKFCSKPQQFAAQKQYKNLMTACQNSYLPVKVSDC